MRQLADNKATLNCLAFSPDGALLAAGGYRGVIQLWDVAAGQLVGRLVGLDDSVHFVGFAANDFVLAAASSAFRAWEIGGKTGRIEGKPWVESSYVRAADLSPDRKTLAISYVSRSGGYGFDVFRLPEDKPARRWGPFDFSLLPVAFAFGPGGATYAGHDAGLVRGYDVAAGASLGEVARSEGWLKAMAASPDGRRLACAAGSHLHLFGLDTPGEIVHHRLGRTHFLSVAFHPSGDFFASANGDGKVDYWDGRTGEHRQAFDWQVGKLHDVIFDATGDRAACCSKTGQIVVWDVDR